MLIMHRSSLSVILLIDMLSPLGTILNAGASKGHFWNRSPRTCTLEGGWGLRKVPKGNQSISLTQTLFSFLFGVPAQRGCHSCYPSSFAPGVIGL